jgi:hypothetical protein
MRMYASTQVHKLSAGEWEKARIVSLSVLCMTQSLESDEFDSFNVLIFAQQHFNNFPIGI